MSALASMGLGFGLGMRPLSVHGSTPPEPTDYEKLIDALTNDPRGQGWFWDFTRQDKLFQDSAGTTPVAALNDPVGRVLDAVRAVPIIQATAANRPTWKQGAGALFDGSNDGLVTAANIDLTATDEVMVFVGLRKMSDANLGNVLELSATNATNNRVFIVWAPGSAAPRLDFVSKGTLSVTAPYQNAAVAAPVSAVVSGVGKISTDTCELRVDGGLKASPTTDQGTGNYGSYPIYVGRRGGALYPFNGYMTCVCIIPYIDADLRALAESVIMQLNQGLPV